MLFDADGTNPRPLALQKDPEVDDSPDHVLIAQSWSPDGTRLVYNTAHIVGGLGVQRIHVATIDAPANVTRIDRYEYDPPERRRRLGPVVSRRPPLRPQRLSG